MGRERARPRAREHCVRGGREPLRCRGSAGHAGPHEGVQPARHVVAELAEEAEGVLHVELDLNEVVDYRQRSPYLRDRRPDLYDLVLLP